MSNDNQRTIDLLREKVEVLTGERAGGAKKAVRTGDLDALRKLQVPTMTARPTGATPTAAEFNKLVDDVQALAKVISSIIGSV